MGLKSGMSLLAINQPAGYFQLLGPISKDSTRPDGSRPVDLVHLFVSTQAELNLYLPSALPKLKPTGCLWVSWPKRSSGFQTNLSENTLREVILPTGLVDTKVIAIDSHWSGLKFVWRKR